MPELFLAGSARHLVANALLHASALALAPAWLPWMLSARKRRANFLDRVGLRTPTIPEKSGSRLWVHAVSVGETLASVPVVRAIRSHANPPEVVFSTVTLTGREVACKSLHGLLSGHLFFPFDLPLPCRVAFDRVSPDAVAVMETEIWPNFAAEAARRGIPVAILNGRLSDRSFAGYLRFRSFFASVLPLFGAIAAQTSVDAERFVRLGAPESIVSVSGNVKFDLSPPVSLTSLASRMSADRKKGRRWVVAGSTHEGEEEMVLAAWRKARETDSSIALVLVPRHPERFDAVQTLIASTGLSPCRWSTIMQGDGPLPDLLILDTMGELLSAFSEADVAFVGGSLVPTGGHNLLEPALFGVPVVTGPHLDNFRDIAAKLTDADALTVVSTESDLAEAFLAYADGSDDSKGRGSRGKAVVEANRGAAGRCAEIVRRMMPTTEAGR